MTLLIRRRAIIGMVMLVTLIVLAGGAYAFHLVNQLAHGTLGPKFVAERLLFVAVVVAAMVVTATVGLSVRAVSLTNKLEKLVSMNKMTGFSPQAALSRLGDVGEKIASLQRQTVELSAKKSRKIAGLTSLMDHILSMSTSMVLVSDVTGTITHASRSLVERLDVSRNLLIGTELRIVFGTLDLDGALRSIRRSRGPATVPGADSLILTPIYSQDGEVHYVVIVINRAQADLVRRNLVAANGGAVQPLPARKSILPRLMRRFRNTKN